jgi:hypothetical protein
MNFGTTREWERVGLREIKNNEFIIAIHHQFYL